MAVWLAGAAYADALGEDLTTRLRREATAYRVVFDLAAFLGISRVRKLVTAISDDGTKFLRCTDAEPIERFVARVERARRERLLERFQ
jgi:hypothetical protein